MSIIWLFPALIALGGTGALVVFLAICFRIVVLTNMVHIVQRRKTTTSYGTGQSAGNVYYRWPSWVPHFGVTTIELPVSNFSIPLNAYEAYDKDRVPFVVDVVAFFRISDPNRAAERVSSFTQLNEQLKLIVQGAVRKILAGAMIHDIMLKRAEFGRAFTDEVAEQLKEWGTDTVKLMELMDIRDHVSGGKEAGPIHNIMAMQMSHIEQESRSKVAENLQKAQTAEIDAERAVKVRAQEAEQAVGERTALKDQAVGVANQTARQEILTAEKETAERTMAVNKVNLVRQAEITREQQVVAAEQDKQTTVIIADGKLQEEQKRATAIQAIGLANADAARAMQLAPVEAQITLAKEIGSNDGYQRYLVSLEAIKAHVVVGSAQAEALKVADVKVIANTGDAPSLDGVANLFTAKGGLSIGSMLEAFGQTPVGKAALNGAGIHVGEEAAK